MPTVLSPLAKLQVAARQRAIGQGVGAAACGGDDMFQVKAIAADALGSMTVFAAPAGAGLDTAAQTDPG